MEQLRSLLDENGYREPLVIEAIPLTKHLLFNTLALKKQFNEKNINIQHLIKKNEELSVATECYQEENGHVISDNNDLRMKNLKLKEISETERKEHKNASRKLQTDKENLIFLVKSLKKQLPGVESESFNKSQKLLQSHDINPQSIINNSDISKPQIQMDSVLTINPRCKVKCAQCGCAWRSHSHETYTADMLQLTNDKVNKLHDEIDRQDDTIKLQEGECSRLQMQVKNREDEIDRLQALLEGGRSVSTILEDNKLRMVHSRIHELQVQLEISEKNREQLKLKFDAAKDVNKMAKSRAIKLADENEDLTVDLENAQSTNRILEQDCNSAASALNDKLAKTQNQLVTCETNLSEQHRLFHIMEKERDQLKEDLGMLGQDHSFLLNERQPLLCDNRKMEGVLKRSQEEKKHMIDKINHLTVHLQESEVVKQSLQDEVSSFHSRVSELEHHLKTSQFAKEALRKQEAEVTRFNAQLELVKNQLNRKLAKLGDEKNRIEDDRNIFKEQLTESQKEKQSLEQARNYYSDDVDKLNIQLDKLRNDQTVCLQKLNKFQVESCEFEKEKNYYSEQVAELLHILKTPPSSTKNGIGVKSVRRYKTIECELGLGYRILIDN